VIPDSILNGIYEFKDVNRLADARGQISAMGELAERAKLTFNIFVSPRLESGDSISATVKAAVDRVNGTIWQLDPSTGMLNCLYGSCLP
jgi:hypothetical protein